MRPVGQSCNDDTYGSYNADANCFLIKQDQDITRTVYELAISKSQCPFIDSVQVKKNNAYTDVLISNVPVTLQAGIRRVKEIVEERFVITVDFNDRIDVIKLTL